MKARDLLFLRCHTHFPLQYRKAAMLYRQYSPVSGDDDIVAQIIRDVYPSKVGVVHIIYIFGYQHRYDVFNTVVLPFKCFYSPGSGLFRYVFQLYLCCPGNFCGTYPPISGGSEWHPYSLAKKHSGI